MATSGPDERDRGDEPIEELVEEAREENPDPTTRREAYELELMLPPVTAVPHRCQMTPHSTCNAVCVRINA